MMGSCTELGGEEEKKNRQTKKEGINLSVYTLRLLEG